MKHNVKNNLISFSIYFLGMIALLIFLIVFINNERDVTDDDGLRLALVLQDKASKLEPSISVWGPIQFNKNNVTCSIKIGTFNLNNNWAEGSVSLIEAKHFEDENSKLKTLEQIKAVLNQKSVDGKANIIENYSFDFAFSSYKGVTDGYAWEESDTTKEKYFDLEKAGRYYILLEYYSEVKSNIHYPAINFQFKILEKTTDGVCYMMALFLLFLLTGIYFIKLLISIFSNQDS